MVALAVENVLQQADITFIVGDDNGACNMDKKENDDDGGDGESVATDDGDEFDFSAIRGVRP